MHVPPVGYHGVPVVQWLSLQDKDMTTRVQILDLTYCISHSAEGLVNMIMGALADYDAKTGCQGLTFSLSVDLSWLSWVMYCGYTKPKDCL